MYEWLVRSLRISRVNSHASPQSVRGRWPSSHSSKRTGRYIRPYARIQSYASAARCRFQSWAR